MANPSVGRVKAVLVHKAFTLPGNHADTGAGPEQLTQTQQQSKEGMKRLLKTYEARKTNSHLVVSLILFNWLILHTYHPLTISLKALTCDNPKNIT